MKLVVTYVLLHYIDKKSQNFCHVALQPQLQSLLHHSRFSAGFHRELTANQTFDHQEQKLSDDHNSNLSCTYVTG